MTRPAFEALLAEISTRLLSLPASAMDAELPRALRQFCEHLGLDRGSLSQIAGADGERAFTHSWASDDAPPTPRRPVAELFPWANERLRSAGALRFSSLDELPAEATVDRESFRRLGTKSCIAFALCLGDEVLGSIGFSMARRECAWPPLLVSRLQLVAQLFACALAHRRTVDALREAGGDAARAEHRASRRAPPMAEFATSLAHELNQPLGAILRNAEAADQLLEADAPDLALLRAIIADIRRDDERASGLIERLRMQLRGQQPELAAIDLAPLVREVVATVRADAADLGVDVVTAIDPDLPQVRADRLQLHQVLVNLARNGIDAIESAQASERVVTIGARCAGSGVVEVSVRDTGPGIAAGAVDRLFEPFFTTKPRGLGMGLPLAKSIVEAHGGRIRAENAAAGGATLRFTLGAVTAQAPA